MTTGQFFVLALIAAIGIGGLFLSSTMNAGPAYPIGLVIFGLAIIAAFYLIRRHFDRVDAGH
jgi:hypothetical protein